MGGGCTLPRSLRPAPGLGPPASAQAWLKRQISVGSALRVGSPDPAQPSSLREPGAQDPTGPQAPEATQMAGPGPTDCVPSKLPLPLGHSGRDGEEGHCRLRAWARPVGGLGEGSGALQDTPQSVPWAPQLTCQARGRVAGGPRGEGQDPPLTSLSPEDHHSMDHWLNGPTNSGSLTAGHLGEVPTAVPTSG